MSELARIAAEYYRLGGYEITREAPGFFEAETADPETQPARVFVWADETLLPESKSLNSQEMSEREDREKMWLRRFSAEMGAAPGVTGYFLVPQRRGLSAHFISAATKMLSKGGIRVPIQLFDTAYKADEGGRKAKASVAAAVFASAEKIKRVPQPFFRRQEFAEKPQPEMQGDIVEYLKRWIARAGRGPRFCLIDGSAGGGKTVAFNELAAHAYKAFMERKNRRGTDGAGDQDTAGRPIIFLPQHLRTVEHVGYVNDIIAAANGTDMAAPATPDQFRWLLINGFSLWMFDGLDEFYEGSDGFFAEIEAALDMPGSRACILICTRDSLLTSCTALRAFVEGRFARGSDVEILELAPWGEASWRTIAALELGEGAIAGKFVASLKASPIVADLARLPFYCRVLIELFKNSGDLPSSEFDLLDVVFERMIGREHDKAIFRWVDFVDVELLSDAIEEEVEKSGGLRPDDAHTRQAVLELLEEQGKENVTELLLALAHAYRRTDADGRAGWIFDTIDIKELTGNSYLSNALPNGKDLEDERRRKLNVLVQFAFFGAGARAGTVGFTHPIIADYLAARYALMLLRRGMDALPAGAGSRTGGLAMPKAAIQQAVGTAPLDVHSIFFRAIERKVKKDEALAGFVKSMPEDAFERSNVTAFMRALLKAL